MSAALRNLLEHYWLRKDQDKELYSKTKQGLGESRKFIRDQLGWQLINNERILKIEKIPARAESFMGITEFRDIMEYCIFTALLIYLEDKEDGEQFLLSELVDLIAAQLQDQFELDWTKHIHRMSLIRVLQFAESKGVLFQ